MGHAATECRGRGFRTVDAVAKWLRVDDGDEERLGLDWRQEVGGAYAVRLELRAG